jgi:hypothetical protein
MTTFRTRGPTKSPRISFRISGRDQQRLQDENAVTVQAASLIRDIKEDDTKIRDSFRKTRDTLIKELKELPEKLDQLIDQEADI